MLNLELTDNRSTDPEGPVPESTLAKLAEGIVRQRSWNRAGSSETTAKAAAGEGRFPRNGRVLDPSLSPYVEVDTLERTHAPIAGGAAA